ncbi:MAG: hypothetical protein QM752_06760 [Gammaproteobacteria bacterium]
MADSRLETSPTPSAPPIDALGDDSTIQPLAPPQQPIKPKESKTPVVENKSIYTLKEYLSDDKGIFTLNKKNIDPTFWNQVKFGSDQARITYDKLQLLYKITYINVTNLNSTKKDVRINLVLHDWQLYLLAGGKLPLVSGENPDLPEHKALQEVEARWLQAKDNYGRDILRYAALGGDLETLEYLLKKLEAKKTDIDDLKSTMVPYAAVTGLLPKIENHIPTLYNLDTVNARLLNSHLVSLLSCQDKIFNDIPVFDNQISWRYLDPYQRNYLHYAAIAGKLPKDLKKELQSPYISNDIQNLPHKPDVNGTIPLGYAVKFGNTESPFIDELLAYYKDSFMTSVYNIVFFAAESGNSDLFDKVLKLNKTQADKALAGTILDRNLPTFLAHRNKFQLFDQAFKSGNFDINYQKTTDVDITTLGGAVRQGPYYAKT